jgi:hypothetical protein
MIEAIQEKMAHDLDSKRDALFIRGEKRAMKRGHGFYRRILDPEKKVKSRDLLAIIGKILGNHLCWERIEVVFAQYLDKRRSHDFCQDRMIV